LNNVYAYLEKINRDPYLCAKPAGFLDGFFAAAAGLLSRYGSLCSLIGVDAAGIAQMYAQARQNAYKIINDGPSSVPTSFLDDCEYTLLRKRYALASLRPALPEDLSAVFGILKPWDRFFLNLNYDANLSFVVNRLTFSGYYNELTWSRNPLYGRMFLENAAWVETFITNAAYDLVVFTPALPEALARHASILSSSRHDVAGPAGASRPGQILLTYHPGSVPGSNAGLRTIRFPRYSRSGHAVTITEGAEMLADVMSWLWRTGGVSEENQGE
jgi:hypothetical protein